MAVLGHHRRYHANHFFTSGFSEFWISNFLNQKSLLFEANFTILDHFMLIYCLWSLPDQFWRFLKVFGKFKKSKMADPRWPPFANKTLLWRHMTSSAEIADLNGNIFGHTIRPLSFVVMALVFSELRGGGGIPPPVPQDPKQPGLHSMAVLGLP